MHIPASMLHGQVCPVTLAVGAASVVAAAKIYTHRQQKVSPARWAGVSAFIFALQMLNFPVVNGTSGHVVGGVLAASLLGVPAGILSLSLVLFVQAVFFADGGINALGANVINMGIIGVGLGGLLLSFLKAKKFSQTVSLTLASVITVVVAALSCSVQIALCGAVTFGTIAKAMLPVHALIGVGEAILTVVLCRVLSVLLAVKDEKKIFARLACCSFVAVACAPLASRFPDGLESAALKLGLDFSQLPFLLNWFSNYQMPFIAHTGISVIAAGMAGCVIIWSLVWIMFKRLSIS